ncbi:DNA primase subunit [Hexamita inflata]|uniref:DNA primase subunit n=1 Tax=Hexamita inflata TaxID=28002 RepID=A0AA86R660_9EUKA|nr:DNA primase subunit [Hexamita inflata]
MSQSDTAFYLKPNPAMFDAQLDQLSKLVSARMTYCRKLQIDKIFVSDIVDQVQDIVNEHKGNDLHVLVNPIENQLSYWICRFAMTSIDDAEWLCRAETLIYLLNTKHQNLKVNNLERLTSSNVSSYFPPHLFHLLPDYSAEKYFVCKDFEVLAPLLPFHLYQVLNRVFIIKQSPMFETHYKTALFINQFKNQTETCQKIYNDSGLDPDFKQLLLKTTMLKFGAVQMQSMKEQVKNGLTLDGLESLIKRGALPLCAVRLIRHMQKFNKLKYQERLQLTTYLYDAGMKVEDTISLFKRNFCANGKMTEDKFKKEYEYNIQHVYGNVGAKKGAHCQSCSIIMESVPSTGFAFGCPFRSMTTNEIEEMITTNIPYNDYPKLLANVRKPLDLKYYEAACHHLFQEIFDVGTGGSNPAKYSQAAMSKIKGAE